MSTRWDPQQYAKFSDHRSRPFADLLARVGAADPALVVDLGCGNGPLTLTLADRWPGARIVGVDSSPQMLTSAREARPRRPRGVGGGRPRLVGRRQPRTGSRRRRHQRHAAVGPGPPLAPAHVGRGARFRGLVRDAGAVQLRRALAPG